MINNCDTKKYAMALGYFDGLHLAHAKVLENTLKYKENGLVPAVLLFDEHPRKVLFGENVGSILQTELRDEMLDAMGLEKIGISFAEIMNMAPEEFVCDVLIKKFNVAALVSGYNYRFGKNGAGDSTLLRELCLKHGVAYTVCPEFDIDGEPVSSTRIRNAVLNGNINSANKLLGYTFRFCSDVFHGDARGRLLGTPTVNQYLPDNQIVPKFGVYASYAVFDGKMYKGVTNIGCRPTFDGKSVRSETFIFDFSGNLYGKTVEIRLCKFIREEKKFPDFDTLKGQIEADAAAVREYFEVFEEKN